jgi:hypothetical protein
MALRMPCCGASSYVKPATLSTPVMTWTHRLTSTVLCAIDLFEIDLFEIDLFEVDLFEVGLFEIDFDIIKRLGIRE